MTEPKEDLYKNIQNYKLSQKVSNFFRLNFFFWSLFQKLLSLFNRNVAIQFYHSFSHRFGGNTIGEFLMNMRRMHNFYLEMASRDIFAFHIWHSRQECQIAEQIFITVWQTKWRPKVDTPFPRSLSLPLHILPSTLWGGRNWF